MPREAGFGDSYSSLVSLSCSNFNQSSVVMRWLRIYGGSETDLTGAGSPVRVVMPAHVLVLKATAGPCRLRCNAMTSTDQIVSRRSDKGSERMKATAKLTTSMLVVGMACFSFVLVGCSGSSGPGTAHLSGQVTLDGKPLPDDAQGVIVFQPAQLDANHRAVSTPIEAGHYNCPDAPVGKVRALIDVQLPTGKVLEGPAGRSPEYRSVVAQQNNKGIAFEITGSMSRDFNVESQ